MRIHVMSDLHLEFHDFSPPPLDCDVVVLAGDIAEGHRGVTWARSHFRKPVILVAGNHEFYNRDRRAMSHIFGALSSAADKEGSNIHFCERRRVDMSGVRFLGCTLWTDFSVQGQTHLALLEARRGLWDFNGGIWVTTGYEGEREEFTPELSVAIHRRSVSWLDEELAKPFDGTTVVVTHHAPSLRSSHPVFAGAPLNGCFASSLEWLIEKHQPALWVHGHMHNFSDYRIGNTRVVCNPRGYTDSAEHADAPFNPNLVIEL
jgi:3',5'-cyclic AMP phosphodiesterase CpdA